MFLISKDFQIVMESGDTAVASEPLKRLMGLIA